MRIIKATYGSGNCALDVTERLQGLVQDGQLRFVVSNSVFTDPCPGRIKSLHFTYQLVDDDQVGVQEVVEHGIVQLPISGTAPGAKSNAASLEEIGSKYGTDKVDHGYLPHYERLFAPFRFESFDMLEIGVFGGASIRMWHEYFPAARIIGLDLNDVALGHDLPRYTFVQGDQTDLSLLNRLCLEYKFRLIVDDGSHLWAHQVLSFQTLFPCLRRDGFYVCEDIHTSYGSLAESYHAGARESAATYFFRIAEVLAAGRFEALQTEDPQLHLLAEKARAMTFVRHGVIISA